MVKVFVDAGHQVIAMDQNATTSLDCYQYISMDLDKYVRDEVYRQECEASWQDAIPDLDILINNAAVQLLAPVESLTDDMWFRTLNVNLSAPFLLSRFFASRLTAANGSILNISSIHQGLTKKKFVAYATSKSALSGMTKAMAVDFEGKIRVNAICPAAISTPMLKAGFEGQAQKFQMLESYHPSQMIGSPEEVARLALFISEGSNSFINGAVLSIDGGISSVLHDPD